jgi:hypothetical protein
LLNKGASNAFYFRLTCSFNKDNYKVQQYPQYPSHNIYSIGIFYIFCKPHRKILMEYGLGPTLMYGDPIARGGYFANNNKSKYFPNLQGVLSLRYNLKKIPFTTSISILPVYNYFGKVKFYALPSASIGYAIKKLNYEQKKIRVYY